MDDVRRVFGFGVFIFGVKDEDYLQPSPAVPPADHPPFVLFPQLWVWWSGMFDNPFRLLRRDTMLRNVLDVPVVPSEFHTRPLSFILPYRKMCGQARHVFFRLNAPATRFREFWARNP